MNSAINIHRLRHKKNLALFVLLLSALSSMATHIRGGQIHAKIINGNTVEFVFEGVRDVNGVPFGSGIFRFGDGDVFGDDNDEAFKWEVTSEGRETEIWTFKLVHTYLNPTEIKVSYSEDFRSDDIANIGGSVSTSFYVETMIRLDPLISANSSPRLITNLSLKAILGQKFNAAYTHTDINGDSLVYKLITPLQEENMTVNGYRRPNASGGGTDNSIFELNGTTGNLVWDKVNNSGRYSIAIRVEEWREVGGRSILMGYTTLDFVLNVLEAQQPFIELVAPSFICIEQNENYRDSILIVNDSEIELELEFVTESEALTVNGMNVSDWNNLWKGEFFTDSQIRLDLRISSEDLTSNLGDVILQVTGDALTEQGPSTFNYSINRLIAFGCDETEIVLNIPDKPVFWAIGRGGIEVTFQDDEWHKLAIYTLDGILLEEVNNESSNKINLAYPFVENTVYVILLHSSTGVTTKKIRFTP